jgi:hypothetical protein
MSVLYLTYIPIPTRTPQSGRVSRQVSRDEIKESTTQSLNETERVDMEKGAIETEGQRELAIAKGRDTEDWRMLRQCAQVLSLCRVRDAMGTGMQPMMGYLRYVLLTHSLKVPPNLQDLETCSSSC